MVVEPSDLLNRSKLIVNTSERTSGVLSQDIGIVGNRPFCICDIVTVPYIQIDYQQSGDRRGAKQSQCGDQGHAQSATNADKVNQRSPPEIHVVCRAIVRALC